MSGERPARLAPWRERMYIVIFEHDTPGGKAFDVALLVCILASVIAVILESVAEIRSRYGGPLRFVEWAFTLLFTGEYVLRLACARRPARYARSFFGLVDLLAVVPTYLSLFFAGTQSLIVIRSLRLLRVFRVMKLVHFVGEEKMLRAALTASIRKIVVFLGAVLTLMVIIGALMYLIEGEQSGFTSIPESIYWAIVTMTTVGYGDIAPVTLPGKFLASLVMIIGYGIIAVPTGIVTVEMSSAARRRRETTCPRCGSGGHPRDARYCWRCGEPMAFGPASSSE